MCLLFIVCLVSKKDNKIEYNHKQNKLEQLKGFCAMVEEGSLEAAATKRCLSSSAISAQYLSLAQELSIDLFSKKGNRCVLTPTGAEVYKESRRILNEIEAFYANGIARELSRLDYFLMRFRVLCSIKLKDYKKDTTKFVKKFYRYIITVVFFGVVSYGFYLYQTNFMFDRALYETASPRLKSLIKDTYQDISENETCSFAIMQLNIDMYNLIDELTKKYKNLPITMFMVAESPIISMRFSGDKKIDSALNTDKLITCNTQMAYNESAKLFKKTEELFVLNKNFKIYNLYHGDINKCIGCDQFVTNTKKYPDNLFGKKISKSVISDSRGWIIKYGSYYYTFFVLDMIFDDTVMYPQHVMWQKMTEEQLMHYNKGKLWNILSNSNVPL